MAYDKSQLSIIYKYMYVYNLAIKYKVYMYLGALLISSAFQLLK